MAAKKGFKAAATRRTARKILATDEVHIDAIKKIEELAPANREKIVEFVQSGEFAQFGLQVTIAIAAKDKAMQETLRDSVNKSLRLYKTVPDEHVDAVSHALFQDLVSAITIEMARLDSVGFTEISAKVVASQAAAALRNREILGRLTDISAFDDFCRDFTRQVSLLDSRVRPPQVDAGKRIPIDRIYVESTLNYTGDSDEVLAESVSPKYIFESHPRIVILGDPGGGKSTLAAKVCVDLARGRRRSSTPPRVPFRVIVRDYGVHFQRAKISITQYLEKVCSATYSTPAPEGAIEYLLLNGRAALVFDGLDELTEAALRQDMVQAVEAFCTAYPSVPVMVTSRKVGYDLASLDSQIFQTLHLGQFGPTEKVSYAHKWFSTMRSGSQLEKSNLADDFLAEIRHAQDLSSNPLMLGLMCAMYRGEGYIPRNRPELYRRCAEYLFERWDSSRGISVERPFERGIQFAMFALALSMLNSSENASGLSEARLVQFTTSHLHGRHYEDFDAAQDAAREFVKYCRGRAWVLTDVGTDAYGNDLYAFTHRTFLEYFAGRQLVRECSDVTSLVNGLYPKLRQQEWDVVSQLAIQSLDERLIDGSNEVINGLIEVAGGDDSRRARSAIAAFCCRAVEFMHLRPSTLRAIAAFYVSCLHSSKESEDGYPYQFTSAANGLTKSPSESRRVVVEEIRSVLEGSDSESILGFAAVIGITDGRRESYWIEESRETIRLFEDRYREVAKRRPWFSAILFRQGFISLDEATRIHGVKFLFNAWDRPHGIPSEPNQFVTLCHQRAFPPSWSHLNLESSDIEKICQILIDSPRPWVDTLGAHSWVHDEDDDIPEDKNLFFLRTVNILLGAHLFSDMLDNRRFSTNKQGWVYRALLRARQGGHGVARLEDQLSVFTDCQRKFLTSWAMNEFSFTADGTVSRGN
ncbi:NACHT domain-containing protein [Streptomyces parvus]|uniref:NACHT domain-containing protein n=1 Tax=Streptomyces parvus TaxID=66428 RepID=UPI0033D16A53